MKPLIIPLLLLLTTVLSSTSSIAHELRPGLLSLTEIVSPIEKSDTLYFQVLLKTPFIDNVLLPLEPVLPDSCASLSTPTIFEDNVAQTKSWTVRCLGSLTDREITIVGLDTTMTDFLVRISYQNGGSENARLTASNQTFKISGKAGVLSVAKSYGAMGVEHILSGIDHLLFVFALLLLSRNKRELIKTITAFTIAHSITLTLSALGIMRLASAPVEATILLSIIFLANELSQKNSKKHYTSGLTDRFPWLVAFIFGLLHGLGFASALSNIGLPEQAITVALFFFNIGVEIGKLLFIATALLALSLIKERLPIAPKQVKYYLAYAIGGISTFWFIGCVTI